MPMLAKGIDIPLRRKLWLSMPVEFTSLVARKEMLEATAKESPHGNIVPLVGDVTSKDDLECIVSYIKREIGYLNVLIANSGISGPQPSFINSETTLKDFQSALWKLPFDAYTNTSAVNVSAVFFTVVASSDSSMRVMKRVTWNRRAK